MKRILISSFSFAKDHGSESELGWRFVESLKGKYEVVVFVSNTYRHLFEPEDISALAEESIKLEFEGFDGPIGKIFNSVKFARLRYILWQRLLPGWVCQKYDPESFDLVHHVSWATFSSPTSLWKLKRPFIVGPVGGGEVAPLGLLKGLPLKSLGYEIFRALRIMSKRWDRKLGRTIQAADVFWVSNPDTECQCRHHADSDSIRLKTQVSIPDVLPEVREKPEDFVIVTAARLVPLKRIDILVRAFLRAEKVKGELRIIGDGPELVSLKKLVEKSACSERKVIFRGWLEREEVALEFRKASVFAFSSLHDSASFAVLEAMSHGLAVIAFGCGGPPFLIRNGAGIVVKGSSIQEVEDGFREGFCQLYETEGLVESLSVAARKRACELTRSNQNREVLDVYESVLKANGNQEGERN